LASLELEKVRKRKGFCKMEERKAATEVRKQRSLALEKRERSKKKSKISEKKEQKNEVKKKIEASLPTSPPSDGSFHCSACSSLNNSGWRGWVCLDSKKHQSEWMLKERRVMVKDAFQEQAKAMNGFSKLRKLGAAKKNVFSTDSYSDDDDYFSEEEDDNEDMCERPTEILEDLSAFLVNKSKDNRPRKQIVRILPEVTHKPRPIVIESDGRFEEESLDVPQELLDLVEHLDVRTKQQQQHILLHSDIFSCVCPARWSRALGATLPPVMLLEHKERDLTIVVAEMRKLHQVSACSVVLINNSASVAKVRLNIIKKDRILTLSNLCHLADGMEARPREKKAPLMTEIAQLQARETQPWDSWTMMEHQQESWEMVDMEEPSKRESLCRICLELTHLPLALAGCGHGFCHSCWSNYLVTSVLAGAKFPLRCPESSCSQPVDLVTSAFVLSKYASTLPSGNPTWETLLHRSVKALSLYHCHRCQRRSHLNDGSAHCPCGEHRCLDCGLRDHWPASCSDFAVSRQLSKKDLSSRRVQVEIRSCPRCHECWEKTYGCNHMICSRCGTSFCWGCGKESRFHPAGFCGEMVVPLETKVLSTSGLFGLSSQRLDSIEEGLKRLRGSTQPWSDLPQARRVAWEAVGRCQPELWFQHTRRTSYDLHLLPQFAKVEAVVESALASFRRCSQFTRFGYLTGAAEHPEVRTLLLRLDGDLRQVEQLLNVDLCNPRSLVDWRARLVSVTARIEERMERIGGLNTV